MNRSEKIKKVYETLYDDFGKNAAPVIDLMASQGAEPFQILVATMLSARTRDDTTARVTREQLFPVVKTPDDIRKIPLKKLEQLIYPVGFYRDKARHLKELPDALDEKFGGVIPDTVEELCELPGVGRKTANLVVAVAFGKQAICVDVHVHRISNRLGIVKTQTPYETEMALRKVLPPEYWIGWNGSFVSFGQRICRPVNPKCSACPLSGICPSNGSGGKTK